ncbi:MAG: cytidylate kinase family protein, partial [Planctomycetota bacterium]
ILEKERVSKPSLLKDFLRGLKKTGIPDGYEIRNKITMMVRTIAFEGHAVILGQGGTAATGDLANGLSIRVEAPKDWRIARICRRENLEKHLAIAKIEEIEKDRDRLRQIYQRQNTRAPAFNLVFDNASFTNEQIADLVIIAMAEKGFIEKEG